MKEIWKAVLSFNNYEVSNLGNVRRAKDFSAVAQSKNKKGYLQFTLFHDGNKFYKRTHREILKAFCGYENNKMHACHNDGNKNNNKLDNLRWDTPANNNLDKVLHGTSKKGILHHSAKLSESQVTEIFLSIENGPKLAEIYKVSKSTIEKIKYRKKWQHITLNLQRQPLRGK